MQVDLIKVVIVTCLVALIFNSFIDKAMDYIYERMLYKRILAYKELSFLSYNTFKKLLKFRADEKSKTESVAYDLMYYKNRQIEKEQ